MIHIHEVVRLGGYDATAQQKELFIVEEYTTRQTVYGINQNNDLIPWKPKPKLWRHDAHGMHGIHIYM